MKKYTIENFIQDKTNITAENYKAAGSKHYYITDMRSKTSILSINNYNETKALGKYLSSYASKEIENNKQYIDLGIFADRPYNYFNFDDYEDVFITYLTEAETRQIDNTLNFIKNFTEQHIKEFWVENPRYADDFNTMARNFVRYFKNNKENITKEETQHFYTCNKIFNTNLDYLEEEFNKRKERQQKFIDSFMTIFDNCLDFNVDLELNHEKQGGLKEQQALEIVNRIGGYNNFDIDVFKDIITYCSNNFTKYYNEFNPNNYSKDYTIYLGRENSVVCYLKTFIKNDVNADDIVKDLEKIANADEVDLVSESQAYGNNKYITIRLWWD